MKRAMLIDDYPVLILPKLAEEIGLNKAIVLQQIHFWLTTYNRKNDAKHFADDKWWVWNTYEDWQENFPWWSTRTIQRTILDLEEDGYLISRQPLKSDWDKTKHYTIDYDKLALSSTTDCHNLNKSPETTQRLQHRETEKPDNTTKSGETSQDDDDTQKWLDEKEKNKPPQLKREPGGTKRALEKYAQRQTGNAEIENYLVKLPERVRPIARVFCEYFGRAPIKKENSYWRTEWESQADLGLLPKHISAAIADMDNNGLHIKSPASVTSISERFKREGTANAPGTGVTQVWKGGERIR